MKTMIRRLAVLASLALSSALFAGSIDFQTSSSLLSIDVSATSDCRIELYDTNTNQLVADFVFYVGSAAVYNSGSTHAEGISLYFTSYTSVDVYNLPEGNYRIVTIEPFPWNWGSYSSGGGGWGGVWDYDYYDPYSGVQVGITNSGGWFY